MQLFLLLLELTLSMFQISDLEIVEHLYFNNKLFSFHGNINDQMDSHDFLILSLIQLVKLEQIT